MGRQFHAAHPVLLAGADGQGGSVAGKDDGIGGHSGLHGPGKAQIVQLRLAGRAGGDGKALSGGGRGGQKVRVRENAVHKGFLHNDAAVRQAFDVQEGRMGQLFQPPQAGQFHNAQIFGGS